VANTKSRTPRHRLIEADDDLREGVRALRRKCEVMRRVHDVAGHPPLRRRPGGFEGLARIIVGQQVSVASAEAIWGRTLQAVQPFEPQVLLALKDRSLVAAGLSGAKIRTLRAVATAAADRLDLAHLDHLSDEEVRAALMAVSGIGPWTADVYLLFCLGHPDAWPAGDLALQEGARLAFGLPERPNARETGALAEPWRPWRGVAARLLWAYYRAVKQRDAVPIPASS
jgi:DNA-3-methyladenine glycosylase II